jgi:uncharacterized protein YuzE
MAGVGEDGGTPQRSGTQTMHVTLQCGTDALTIWLPSRAAILHAEAVERIPNCRLLFAANAVLRGIAFDSDVQALCPYKLAKVVFASAGHDVPAHLQSTYDASVDMGYVYLDKRGAGSVAYSVDCGRVILDVGKDGAVIGIELFSPSTLLPELVDAHAST